MRTPSQTRPPPRSCDTLVYVRAETGGHGPLCTLFGKNSDRPSDEVHEVIYVPAAMHAEGSTVRCTHIEVPQAAQTHAVVLSRPAWLWGCEMGSNEFGVVGGNEAVHSLLASELGSTPRLLGMDLLRLALERGATAADAARICGELLQAHGQGGACAEDDDWTYENGFLFADRDEAYVLETAGVHHWACERVGPGQCRNISNGLSIRSQCITSDGLQELCRAKGWWDGEATFDWKLAVGAGGTAHAQLGVHGREKAGRDHLARMAADVGTGKLDGSDAAAWMSRMATALRDEDSGICFRGLHDFCSTGSQVSWLAPSGGGTSASGRGAAAPRAAPATHLFTCASDPLVATYKRFAFAATDGKGVTVGHRSRELWERWRDVALRGGLERLAGREEAAHIRGQMEATERAALGAAAEAGGGPEALEAVIAAELTLLEAAVSMQGKGAA